MKKNIVRLLPVAVAVVFFSGMQLDASGNFSFGNKTYNETKTVAFDDIVNSNKQTMYLTADTNILSDESNVASTLETAGKGTQVQVLGASGEMCKILTPGGKVGYVNVSKLTSSASDIFNVIDEVKYANGDIEVKQLPSSESTTIATLATDDAIQLTGTNDYEYYQVSINDQTGYVLKGNVKDEATPVVVTTTTTTTTTFVSNGTGLTQSSGVNFYDGRRETYYSSNVLYHYRTSEWTLDEEGFYRSGDYYVVAASDMAQGTTFSCSKGTCIVLDTGCPAGTTDYYVAW